MAETEPTATQANFKEIVLAKNMQVRLESPKAPTLKNYTNRNYEGDIMNTGDTITIIQPDIDSIVTTLGNASDAGVSNATFPVAEKQTFTVDKDGTFGFKLSDRQTAMTNWNYKEGTLALAMDKLGKKHALEISNAILNSDAVTSVAGTAAIPLVVNKDNIISVIFKLASQLYINGATQDMMGGYTATKTTALFDDDGKPKGYSFESQDETAVLQIPVQLYELLIDKLGVTRNTVGADQSLVNAEIKKLLGLNVECDVTLDTARYAVDGNGVQVTSGASGLLCAIAGTKNAVTFASKIGKIETLRDPSNFVDIVRGKEYYGFLLYQPKAVVKAFLTLEAATPST